MGEQRKRFRYVELIAHCGELGGESRRGLVVEG